MIYRSHIEFTDGRTFDDIWKDEESMMYKLACSVFLLLLIIIVSVQFNCLLAYFVLILKQIFPCLTVF